MTIHMSMNISGALRNFGSKKMTGLLEDENGRPLSDKEVRTYLAECQSKGWKVIPAGKCDNFDYQTGCKGHPTTPHEQDNTPTSQTLTPKE